MNLDDQDLQQEPCCSSDPEPEETRPEPEETCTCDEDCTCHGGDEPCDEDCPCCEQEESREETAEDSTEDRPLPEEPEQEDLELEEPASPDDSGTREKMGPGKIALLVVLAVAAIAVVAALIVGGMKGRPDPTENPGASTGSSAAATDPAATTEPVETTEATIPADGNPDDETCKGTYSVDAETMAARRDDVIATLGDRKLTNGQLQVYYWMQVFNFMDRYGDYAIMLGFNPDQTLDTQLVQDGSKTWQQRFLYAALDGWKSYTSLSMEAEKAGFAMPADLQEHLDHMEDDMLATAQQAGLDSANALIQADMGPGADIEVYKQYMENYYLSYRYYGSLVDQINPTDEELEAYFDEHAGDYSDQGISKEEGKLVDVRHILVKPEGGTADENGVITYTDEEWKAGEAAAQAVLDQFLAGDKTAESFAALAQEKSKDPGSAAKGGLYENVQKGQMVPEFDAWCFDDARKTDDTGIVKTEFGYHVMLYVADRPLWKTAARDDLILTKGDEIVKNAVEQHEFQVDYDAIVLGVPERFAK